MTQSTLREQPDQQPVWPPRKAIADKTDVALAKLLLASFGSPTPVFDRGAFRRYSAGHWPHLTEHEIGKRIHQLDGRRCRDRSRLKVSSPKTKNVLEAMRTQAAQPGFFDRARTGVLVFADFTVDVGDHGICVRPQHTDDRAKWAFPYDCPIRCAGGTFDLGYIASAMPNFQRYLSSTFDDPEKHRFLAAWLGLTLLGLITTYELALILRGRGANGKSVLMKVVEALFRFAGVVSIPPSILDGRFQSAPLANAMINLVDELPLDERLDNGVLKAAISGGVVHGELKQGPVFSFMPRAGHIFATNHPPRTRDHSDGFFRRFAVVDFTRTFSGSSIDKDLAGRIIDRELPGVVSWALHHAARALCEGRLAQPACVRAATAEWRHGADVVSRFIALCCEPCTTPVTPGAQLYHAFARWAADSRISPAMTTTTRFWEGLQRLGIAQHRDGTASRYGLTLLDGHP